MDREYGRILWTYIGVKWYFGVVLWRKTTENILIM